jgi:hypothetical protein
MRHQTSRNPLFHRRRFADDVIICLCAGIWDGHFQSVAAALGWMKKVFARKQRLAQRPPREIPKSTVPKRLRSYLLELDQNGNGSGVRGDRYEFWVYRQVRKRLGAGELYLDDSVRRHRFSDELVPIDQKEQLLKSLDIPWLRQVCRYHAKTLSWRKPKVDREEALQASSTSSSRRRISPTSSAWSMSDAASFAVDSVATPLCQENRR